MQWPVGPLGKTSTDSRRRVEVTTRAVTDFPQHWPSPSFPVKENRSDGGLKSIPSVGGQVEFGALSLYTRKPPISAHSILVTAFPAWTKVLKKGSQHLGAGISSVKDEK